MSAPHRATDRGFERSVRDSEVSPSPAGSVTVRTGLMANLGIAARLAGTQPSAPCTPHPSLLTPRLTLRPLSPTDRPEFLRVLSLSRDHLDRFCPLDKTNSIRAEPDARVFARQLALSDAALATGRAWRCAAFDHDARLIGAFNINDIARGLEHTGEIVFWLSADALGRGYAEEGVRAALDHAFADLPRGLGLHRVSALIAPDNAPCLKLAHKVGLRRAAAPQTTLILRARPVDHDTYAAFASIDRGVVEAKPSVAENLFGRGLLSILRTEATPHYPPADAA